MMSGGGALVGPKMAADSDFDLMNGMRLISFFGLMNGLMRAVIDQFRAAAAPHSTGHWKLASSSGWFGPLTMHFLFVTGR
jgi:hypothetical protein